MATQSVPEAPNIDTTPPKWNQDVNTEHFTNWGRGMDVPTLDLSVQRDNRIVESIELDVRDLPDRPDLLERMPPKMRNRMLWEARETRKGNLTLNPVFPGYSAEPIGDGADQFPPHRGAT